MKIALFDAAKFWSGGAERVYLCAKGFKEKGHNVILVCLPTSRLNSLFKKQIKIYNISPVFDLDFLAAIKILIIILKNKIEVLDIHSPKFYWLGVFIGKLLGCRVFITRNVEYRKKGLKKITNRILYKLCDGIITISEKIKENMIEDFGINKEKIRVIKDAYIVEIALKENIKEKYKISTNAFVLSIIGRVEKNKRQDIAVELLKSLINKNYDCYLFIVGPIENMDFYKKLLEKIENLKLSNKIFFTGYVKNVGDYIVTSDIVLCCSEHEGISKSVVESLLLGKPIVSLFPFEKDGILNSELLFIIPNRDFDRFVKIVEQLLLSKTSSSVLKEELPRKFEVGLEEMVKSCLDFYRYNL